MLSSIEQRCCFVSDAKIHKLHIEYAIKRLNSEMNRLIEEGVRHFVCSSDQGLNFIAAGLTIALRESYPDIIFSLILPFSEYFPHLSEEERSFISDISREADEVQYLYDHPSRENMREYARYIIDNAMYCISFTKNQKRAVQLRNYAQSKNRRVIELAEGR